MQEELIDANLRHVQQVNWGQGKGGSATASDLPVAQCKAAERCNKGMWRVEAWVEDGVAAT